MRIPVINGPDLNTLDTRELGFHEEFRQVSLVRVACVAANTGRDFDGYLDAFELLVGGGA